MEDQVWVRFTMRKQAYNEMRVNRLADVQIDKNVKCQWTDVHL